MINTTSEYRKAIEKNRQFRLQDRIIAEDGKAIVLSLQDVTAYSIDEATSTSGKFEIGAAIAKEYKASLNNMDGKFDGFNFEKADIIAKIGLHLPSGGWEDLQKGEFRIVEAREKDLTIDIKAYDGMLFFDRPYSESALEYPATINQILTDACKVCQMTLNARSVQMGTYVVKGRPDSSAITFRDIVSYCAQIMGCYAFINNMGHLDFGWYEFDVTENDGLDGGIFDKGDPYISGDNADGGTFEPWNTGYDSDSGTFADMGTYHHIYLLKSKSVATSDITITGISVSFKDESNGTEDMLLYGEEGYVLELSDNPLIQKDSAQEVLNHVGTKVVGNTFRPLNVTTQSDPSIEAGDPVVVTDRRQNSYWTVITNTTFNLAGIQKIECGAETQTEKSYTRYGAITKLISSTEKKTDQKLSAYDIASRQFSSLMARSMGLYETYETQEDGSIIKYQHDKPLLSESKTIWKQAGNVFGVSTDGGETWNAATDAEGNAMYNVLSVIGFYFDWARGGELTLGGYNNQSGIFKLLDGDGETILSMDNRGMEVLSGLIAGPTFLSKGLGYIGSTLCTLYTKIENGRYWFGHNNNTGADINSGIYNANIANSGNGIRFIAPAQNLSTTITEFQPKFDFFFDPDNNAHSQHAVFSITPNVYSSDLASKGKRYASAILRGNLIIDPYTASGNSGDSELEDSARFGIGWIEKSTSQSAPSYGIYPIVWGKGASNRRVQGTGIEGSLVCEGVTAASLSVSGYKSRISDTEDYGTLHQYCYEMSAPYFGDIGSGITDENGECYVSIDDKFSETCSECPYYVFLQKEGSGDIWIEVKERNYFVVKGTPNISFSWELKQKQRGYENYRLDAVDAHLEMEVRSMDIDEIYQDELLSMEEFYEQQYYS